MRRWREVKEAGRRSRQKFGPPPPFNSNLSIQINSFIEEKERREANGSSIQPLLPSLVGWIVVGHTARRMRGVILIV